jgi:hypothetical protein
MKLVEIVQQKIPEIQEDDDFGVGQFLDVAVMICDAIHTTHRDVELPEVRYAFNLAYKAATGLSFTPYALYPESGQWQHLHEMLEMVLTRPDCDQDTVVTEFVARVFQDECVRYVSLEWLADYIKKTITEIGVSHE